MMPTMMNGFTRRKTDILFSLFVLFLASGTVFALASEETVIKNREMNNGTVARATIQKVPIHVYHIASSNAGLMQPAIDAHANIWVGEMYANRFAQLDTHTGAVTTWAPPDAHDGIMTTIVDAHGVPWFVEQDANYIGRFDPVQHTFRIFPLGKVHGRPMGPQSLQFDSHGFLWFYRSGGRAHRTPRSHYR